MKTQRFYFLIDREHLEKAAKGCGLNGILDMLRYDQAVVASSPPAGYWMFVSDNRPTVARWASFGIGVAGVTNDRYDIEDLARRLRGKEKNA